MKRIAGMAVLVAALVPTAAVAASTQAGRTRVAASKVYRVGDRVLVDAVVWHPDARDATPSRRATNTGVVRIAVRDAHGRVIARGRQRARLPVSAPEATAVQQTYRFTFAGAAARRVIAADDVSVRIVADTQLDSDGAGGDEPDVSTDADTTDTSVEAVPEGPPMWTHFSETFELLSGEQCPLTTARTCNGRWQGTSAPFGGGMFGQLSVALAPGGTVNVSLSSGGGKLRGYTVAQPGDPPPDRFAIQGGSVTEWRASDVFTGGASIDVPEATATPGGPLRLRVGSSYWQFVGYLACRPVPNRFCSIAPG